MMRITCANFTLNVCCNVLYVVRLFKQASIYLSIVSSFPSFLFNRIHGAVVFYVKEIIGFYVMTYQVFWLLVNLPDCWNRLGLKTSEFSQ